MKDLFFSRIQSAKVTPALVWLYCPKCKRGVGANEENGVAYCPVCNTKIAG